MRRDSAVFAVVVGAAAILGCADRAFACRVPYEVCVHIAWCMGPDGREFAQPLKAAANSGDANGIANDTQACQNKYGQQHGSDYSQQAAGCTNDEFRALAKKALRGAGRLRSVTNSCGIGRALAADFDNKILTSQTPAVEIKMRNHQAPTSVAMTASLLIAACLLASSSAGFAADTAGSVTGTYKMKHGEARIQQTADSKIKFYLNAAYKENVGELSGEAPLEAGNARYADPDNDCALTFKFASAKLVVSQDGSCGMGLNVSAAGTYTRASSATPKFGE